MKLIKMIMIWTIFWLPSQAHSQAGSCSTPIPIRLSGATLAQIGATDTIRIVTGPVSSACNAISCQATITYDPAIIQIGAAQNSYTGILAGWTKFVNALVPGRLILGGYSSSALSTNGGVLANLPVKAIAEGNAAITFTFFYNEGTPQTQAVNDPVRVVTNQPPMINRTIGNAMFLEDSGSQTYISNLNDHFTDPDGGALIFEAHSSRPELRPQINGHSLILDCAPNYNGESAVTIIAKDPNGLQAQTAFTVTILPVNDRPTRITPLPDMTFDEDSGAHQLLLSLSDAFDDIESDNLLNYTADFDPDLLDINVNDGLITPKSNYAGTTEVIVLAKDPEGLTARDTFLVAVKSINDMPRFVVMPGTIAFNAFDAIWSENLWSYFEDVETSDTLANFSFIFSSDSLQVDYVNTTGAIQVRFNQNLTSDAKITTTLRIIGRDLDGAEDIHSIQFIRQSLAVEDGDLADKFDFKLESNSPNPFNRRTTIAFSLPQTGSATLKIYNTAGQLVKTLFDGDQSAGKHALNWNGKNDRDEDMASGIYLAVLQANGQERKIKMTLMK